jgi:trehalose/maltose hydrolase-like predicted phosphorylase
VEQSYDFSCGELTSRFDFHVDGIVANVEVLTFCSRTLPSLVLQEVTVAVNQPTDVTLTAMVDHRGIAGRWQSRWTSVPGEETQLVDGTLAWSSLGDVATCGVSYSTEFLGDSSAKRSTINEEQAPLGTSFSFRARTDRRYRLRQIAAMVPSSSHHQPEAQAIRLVADGCLVGFEALRKQNRAAWADIWRSRILIHGADQRWQALADAAFYYLQATVHPSSASSVHIFGLARWPNYHYYYGHVMWDVETFVLPSLLLLQPGAARTMLDFRTRSLEAARLNARLRGYQGVLFPWESDPELGEEATLGTATGTSYEQHVNMSVALGFAQYVHATGDEWFLRDQAWPVLRGVAEWICSRVERTERGYEIRRTMGIAERKEPEDNVAYVNMAASVTLREATRAARRLGLTPPLQWENIAECLVLPLDTKRGVILDHDDYRPSEEKGATPGTLAGLFPVGYQVDESIERSTIEYYLGRADEYIGSPMLSAFYGAWAARNGDRERSLRLLEEGYAAFVSDRFMNTHEPWRPRRPRCRPSGR